MTIFGGVVCWSMIISSRDNLLAFQCWSDQEASGLIYYVGVLELQQRIIGPPMRGWTPVDTYQSRTNIKNKTKCQLSRLQYVHQFNYFLIQCKGCW